MRCPTCGHENNDLATRCSACGSPLPDVLESEEYELSSDSEQGATSDDPIELDDWKAVGAYEPKHAARPGQLSTPFWLRTAQQAVARQDPQEKDLSDERSDGPEEDWQDEADPDADELPSEEHGARGHDAAEPEPAWDNPEWVEPDWEDSPSDERPEPAEQLDHASAQPGGLHESDRPSTEPKTFVELPELDQDVDALAQPGRRNKDEKKSPGKVRRAIRFLRRHDRAFGIGIGLVVVGVIAGFWYLFNVVNTPSYDELEKDLSAAVPSYSYTCGRYGTDADIPLSHLSVTKREKNAPASDAAEAGEAVASYAVEAEAVFENEAVRVTRSVSATCVQDGEEWAIQGDVAQGDPTIIPLAGVTDEKILGNTADILTKASEGKDFALADIYSEGEFSLTSSEFEVSPAEGNPKGTVVLHCAKSSSFFSYAGDVTAKFTFENGSWELASAEASEGAATRSYDTLVGTWTGYLVQNIAGAGGSCYGAQSQPLSVTITTLGDATQGEGSVRGTISCVAHYHERLEEDVDADKDDEFVEGIEFAGTLQTDYSAVTDSSINIACTTAGGAHGTLEFVLSFGTSIDPSAAVASVTTTYDYNEQVIMFLSRQTTASFTDTYTLARE